MLSREVIDLAFALHLNDPILRIKDSSAKIRLAELENSEAANSFEQADAEIVPICFIDKSYFNYQLALFLLNNTYIFYHY